MKNNFFASCLIALTSISLFSCNKSKPTEEKVIPLEISFNESALECYEDEVLVLSVNTNSNKTPSYTSSDTGVASVSSEGIVFAKKPGSAVLTASIDDKQTTCTLTIKSLEDKHESYITFEKSFFTVGLNDTIFYQIEPTYINENGIVENKSFTFESLNESIVTVDEDGFILPVSSGSCFVSVKSDNVEAKVFVDSYTMTIRTTDDWFDMIDILDEVDARFSIMNDIDFTGVTYRSGASGYDDQWKMHYFIGNINGNGHTISNITFLNVNNDVCLINYGTHIQMSNLSFKNIVVDTEASIKFAIFNGIYKATPVNGGEEIMTTLFSDVMFDIAISSSVKFGGFAYTIYGIGSNHVFFNVTCLNDNSLLKNRLFPLGFDSVVWFQGSFVTNTVYLFEGIKEYTNPTVYKNTLGFEISNVFVTDSLIEANYFASQSFNLNIWNFVPNNIPALK